MAEVRHRTVVEVDIDESRARQKLGGLLALQKDLNSAFGGGAQGGSPTAPSGGAAPGGGAPLPSQPLALPGGYGGHSAPGGAAPAIPGTTQGGAFPMLPPSAGGGSSPGGGAPSPVGGGGGGGRYSAQEWGRPLAQVIQGGGSALTSGGGAGLALAGGAASGVGALMSRIAADESSSGATRGIAGAISNMMIPGAAAAAVTMMATNFRMQVAARRGELDTQNAMAGLTGSRVSYMGAAGMGYTPEEAVAAATAFGNGAGFAGAGATPLGLMRSGASVGALAAYRGQMAAGAGGFSLDPEKSASMRTGVALAQSSGLRGSRIDEYLQAIAANTGTMATQGIKTNIPAVEDFLKRAAITPGLAGSGMGQVRALGALSGAASSARSSILAPFQDIGEQALMGWAYQRADSSAEAAQLVSSMSPQQQLEALRSSGMPADAVMSYFMSKGLTMEGARGTQAIDFSGETPKAGNVRTAAASGLKVASARREANLVGIVGAEDAKMFETQQAVDSAIMALGAGGRDVSAAIISALQSATSEISGMLKDVVGAVQGLIEVSR